MLLRALFAALALTLVAAGPAVAVERGEGRADGPIEARLSYDQKRTIEFRRIRLMVLRDGVEVYSQAVKAQDCPAPFCAPAGHARNRSLRVVDLDADGEREVTLDLFTGGARCCLVSLVYRWDGRTYVPVQHDWGDPAYRLRDVDDDGRPEFVSGDPKFSYAFSSYARSAFPLVLWRYEAGRFTDVTREHRALLRADARRWFRAWRRARGDRDLEPLGPLSAWAADKARLGEWASVRRELRRALRRGWLVAYRPWSQGRKYVTRLERFLRRRGHLG